MVGRDALLTLVDLLTREGFDLLVDITAVDWPEREARFDVVYHWLNLTSQERLRVKVSVADGEAAPSLTGRFKTADWFEREVFDMFGIRFKGHPDLRRILMDSRWQGHPLRKDYPLRGYQIFPTAEPIDPTLLED